MRNGVGAAVAIYRYPVKGLSAEKMDRVVLTPGECLPHDRRFAIALGSTRFDPEHPEWLPKTHFVMLMRDEKLAQLQTRFDAESGVLAIAKNARVLLHARLTDAEGCKLSGEFFTNFVGNAVNGPLRVVSASGHAFADARRKPNATTDKYVSLINHSSIAALEAAMGHRSIPSDFVRIYISTEPRPGASTTGSAAKSGSEQRGCGWFVRLPDARQPKSIQPPRRGTSTSSPALSAPSAILTWAFTPRLWRGARSRSAIAS